MIYHFILNPKSGKSSKQTAMENAIKEACTARQLSYHIYYTTCPGDATEYVRSMVRISPKDKQRFICVGGDGTINEVVNSAPCNPNVEFGVIPHGSGNDFVKNFTNRELFYDIDAQIDGSTLSLDLIKCNECYCVNMINIGFDCAVAKRASSLKKYKLIPPSISYIVSLAITIFKRFGTKMRLIFDNGEIIEKKLTLTAIGNGKFCGGGFKATPTANLQDGILDIVAVDKISRLTFLSLVKHYKAGTFLENENAMRIINYRSVPHFRMEFESPIPICIDGEIKGAKNIDFSVVRNAFKFVVPQGSELIDSRADENEKGNHENIQ